jgi:KDO2-lipid IV(A) lauroyltransferase
MSYTRRVARNKSALAIAAEFYPLRGILHLLQRLPTHASRKISRALVHSILGALPKKRRLVDEQLAFCFPQKSELERSAIAHGCFNNFADGLVSFSRMASLTPKDVDRIVTFEGGRHIEEGLRRGRGVVCFTAHYGNWELMANYIGRKYPKVGIFVRPLDNPKLDALVKSIRSAGGMTVMSSRQAFKDGVRWIRENGIIGLLIDQNFYKGGVFVDFFGRAAATNTLASILARRTGCTLLPFRNIHEEGRVRIICEPPFELSANPDLEAAIQEDTQRMTAIVEGWIRERPEQWFWLHNRWKRRPEAEIQCESTAVVP